MTLRTGIVVATLALAPLTACAAGGTASTTPSPASSAVSPATSASGSSAASASAGAATYTLAEVARHNSQSDCWAVIDKGVYNLTEWINQHPGGPDKIIPLCGTDATDAFHNKHDDESKPNEQLATLKVGDLAG
ncbi:cytochrome b5 domain-containing protein [Micropruina sp.]|uniref:cytochrome b5 domain-containing protein n=1 Tax=Micropruina sp. TaxID=2737536 RepID=UPI0039E50F1F